MPLPGWIAALALCLSVMDAAAETLNVSSSVPGVHVVAADVLPAPPQPATLASDSFCRNASVARPSTAAGRHVAALGWAVTSEEQAGDYTAVGIFSRGHDGTSGACTISDGNVALYRGSKLVAIVYGDPGESDAGGIVGGVMGTLTQGRLRISDWTPPNYPSADIVLTADRIDVVPIADSEIACGGLVVPNLYGKPISSARVALKRQGWRPNDLRQPASEDDAYDLAAGYRADGLAEIESCAGTGYGFCAASYVHPSGSVLNVTSTEGPDSISSYSVACAPPPRQ